MIKEALQWIAGQAEVRIHHFHGIDYADKTLIPVKPPRSESLSLYSLIGLVDLIDLDEELLNDAIIHVEDYNSVKLISRIDDTFKDRGIYASVQPVSDIRFQFGQFYPNDQFIINLQTCFVKTEQIEKLLQIVGNVSDEQIKQVQDDGVTQTVTARVGVARVTDVDLPNPVKLKPYRTFREIEQPESLFVLRADNGPSWALFAADGDEWKHEAIKSIKEYLKAKTDTSIIA